jgi:two-component system NtrC family sensor kinase
VGPRPTAPDVQTNRRSGLDASKPAASVRSNGARLADELAGLSRRILRSANQGVARADFTREVLSLLVDFSRCDEAGLRVNEGSRYYCATLRRGEAQPFVFQMATRASDGADAGSCAGDSEGLTTLCEHVVRGGAESGLPWFTRNGSFWTGDATQPVAGERLQLGGEYPSVVIMRFAVGEDSHGLLLLRSRQKSFYGEAEVEFYEGVAQTVGVALADRRAQAALRERVKELTCLYGIDQVRERENVSLPERLQAIVELLPPAWLYPAIAQARIQVDGIDYVTPGFHSGLRQLLTSDITVRGQRRGFVEVAYTEPRPALDEGQFLREERRLIDAVASQVASTLAHRQAEDDRERFEEQLRHADRLATIGQLAAGVAHELNEPLSSVLGFAQLARKTPGLPKPAADDIDKTVTAALHARDVVSKLMLFARQKMPTQGQVQLNEMVENGLLLLESRCAKAGIRLERRLDAGLPGIAGDSGQLLQVLVNLVVNALQATPAGGRIAISTEQTGDFVALTVADTGAGMTLEVLKQAFIPFFTTKPIGEGTGLGLSVVHGIVTAHGGRIEAESEPQKGSRFRVLLPIARPAEARKRGKP